MLVINDIQENPELYIQALSKRGIKAEEVIQKLLKLNEKRKSTQHELDEGLAELNQLSKQIGQLFKEGKADEANKIKEKTAEIKELTILKKQELQTIVEELDGQLIQLPNIPQSIVPKGLTEDDNEVVKVVGEAIDKPGNLPHWEIADKLNLIDFEAGAKITGSGFPLYVGKGAKLQRALIQYFLDQNSEAGYLEVNPPFLVNEASARGTGQLPDKDAQMYYVNLDNFYLIPTSEVPVTNIYRDRMLEDKDLPVKLTAYSPCFRREAGAHGKDTRGLNRLHQFEKVEIVRIEKPENSNKVLDEMVNHVAKLLTDLDLPYRILRLCAGDLGFAAAITYDFEVYSSAQGRWLEVSSISNFESYQANRLKLRYKSESSKGLCHTLNGSALALPRIMASILENHQENGKIRIPEKIRPYTRFDWIEE